MPGSIENAMPGSRTASLPATMYGSSWVSSADAVAGAVDEVLAVAGRGDDVARGGVDRLRASRPGGRRRTAACWASCSTA